MCRLNYVSARWRLLYKPPVTSAKLKTAVETYTQSPHSVEEHFSSPIMRELACQRFNGYRQCRRPLNLMDRITLTFRVLSLLDRGVRTLHIYRQKNHNPIAKKQTLNPKLESQQNLRILALPLTPYVPTWATPRCPWWPGAQGMHWRVGGSGACTGALKTRQSDSKAAEGVGGVGGKGGGSGGGGGGQRREGSGMHWSP